MGISGSLGIVGGSGALGGAIARALLRAEAVAPGDLWISNRSGENTGFRDWPGIHVTKRNQDLADACNTIILSVPPGLAGAIDLRAEQALVVSVMAGVRLDRIMELTGARRAVRAMSSPAAETGLAYSPWVAHANVSAGDKALLRNLFEACGLTDELHEEGQIDHFTAMTGPVPGFVAFFAAAMVDYAVANGIDRAIATRAVRQLFLASGIALAEGASDPHEHVAEMIAYAGTTAAGLEAMQASPLAESIEKGLAAAVQKARSLG